MRDRDRDEIGLRAAAGGPFAAMSIGCLMLGPLVLIVGGGVAWYFLRGGGSGETQGAVIERYRPQFAQHRAKLRRIAEKLPPVGAVRDEKLELTLDPKPVYDVPNGTFNTAILMAEHCAGPDRQLKPVTEFDLLFEEDEFRTHLLWTGDRSPLAESAKSFKNVGLAERMERSLSVRYLVVARAMWFSPIKVTGETFTGGQLDVELFFFDYESEKLLGSCIRRYGPDPRVAVTFRTDRKENESAEAFIYSNIWSKAREDVAGTLLFGTHGVFDTRKR